MHGGAKRMLFFVYCSRFAVVQKQKLCVSFTVSLDKQVPKKHSNFRPLNPIPHP